MADWGTLLQAGIQAGGEVMSQQEKEKQRKLLADIAARFGDLPNPKLERAAPVLVDGSEEGDVRADPALMAAQQAALARLQGVVDDGGYTLESQAALNKIRGDTARHESAGRGAIRNNLAARGMGGSGQELAMQLAGNQNSAERASEEGMTAAGQAQKAAYMAMMGQGELAGRMRGQGFDEQSKAARAKDMMKKFNAGAQERANSYNLGLPQQDWNNSMTNLRAQSGADGALGNFHAGQATDIRQAAAGYGAAGERLVNGGQRKKITHADGSVTYEEIE